MSETEHLGATMVSVQTKRTKYPYGQLAAPPLKNGAAALLVQVGIPSDIPPDAIVTKADLVYYTRDALTGTRNHTIQRLSNRFTVSTATWTNKPAVTGTAVVTPVGATPAIGAIRLNVSNDVQGYIAGTIVNRGWLVTTNESTLHTLYGPTARMRKPYLDLEYVLPADVPTDLSPDGAAVSVAKPTLTFRVPPDTVAIRVLIDPAADAVSPDWDSGEVPSSAGLLNLATTTYPGLALNATTAWAAYAKGPLGWSDLSEWAEFSRIALPTVAITSPGATTGDKTPPITWTAPAQVSWQALLYDADTGALIKDNGLVTSDDHDWTPPKGLTKVGQRGRAEVRVFGAEDRVQTFGDTTYGFDTHEFELVAAGDAPGVTDLRAFLLSGSPAVTLQWTGPAADEFEVVRDGEWLDRIDGLLQEYTDYSARPGHTHEYRVLPVSDGVVSPNGPFATIMPTCLGIWLIDPDDGAEVLLLGEDPGSFDMPEQAVLHAVLNAPPVRRRGGILPPSGEIGGGILDALDYRADDIVVQLGRVKIGDPGHVYRLVLGDWNIPVTVAVKWNPTPRSSPDDRMYAASIAWWQTRDELPWGE